ncbi:TonB-dependent receptor [Herbaspirillum sp. NPDC101396]|uniref:TonB-dependent receptor n=1 Tax=Herbaspirillum sp. NPDC101396 TaxID=3364005 RepID=UPI00383B6656
MNNKIRQAAGRLRGKTLPSKKYTSRYSLGLLAASFSIAVSAQQTNESSLPEISVSAGKSDSRNVVKSAVSNENSGLPTSVTVIDRAEIDRTNVGRDISDLLRRVPGVMAHTLDQGDIGNSIKMRGFFSSSHGADTAVYIDGVPQNLPSSAINHGMNDMSWLTPEMIDSIDVIKGPFSALYGDQNRSGAVSITTRNVAENSIAISVGSQGSKRLNAVISGKSGPIQSLVVADLYKIGGFRANSDGERGSLFIKESMIQGDSLWAVRAAYQKSDWNAAGFLNVNDLRSGKVSDTQRDPSSPPLWGDARRGSLVLSRAPASGAEGLRVSAYVEDYERRRATGANATALNVAADDRRIMGARGVYDMLFGDKAALAFGADVRRDVGTALNQNWPNSLPGTNYSLDQDLDLVTYGVFAQGQYKLLESLKLLAGLRLDSFDYDISNRKLPAASLSYKQSVATPKFGVVWTPVSSIDLFANRGSGFRSPAQSELSPSGTLGPLGANGGSSFPDLKPSKVTSYDFGFNLRATSRWHMSAASYHTVNDNEIAQIAPNVFGPVGNTTRDGWEVESSFDFTSDFSIYGSFGRIIRAHINSAAPGTASDLSVPRDTYKAGAAYATPFAAGKLLFNADAYFISGVPYFSGTPLVKSYSRPYSRYDLRGTYSVGKVDWTASLVLQPHQYSSEVAVGSTAGLLIDPVARTQVNLAMRYRF